MKGLKKIWNEFKAFISRGNVLDLAVAVVVGAAFTAIVTSLTNDILMPLINSAVGDGDLSSLCTILKYAYLRDDNGGFLHDDLGNRIVDTANCVMINWGNFIQAIIDFILIAIVIFAIVKTINTLRDAGNKINSLAKKEKKISKYTKKYVKEGLSAEEAKAAAEEQYAKETAPAPAAPAKPTTEELLLEIRNLLAENLRAGTTDAETAEKAASAAETLAGVENK